MRHHGGIFRMCDLENIAVATTDFKRLERRVTKTLLNLLEHVE